MRFLFICYLNILIISGCTNNVRVEKSDNRLVFSTLEKDLGDLELGKESRISFFFRNEGNSDVVIHRVKASCGCVYPEWPKKPIRELSRGEISIKHKADMPGFFRKEIKVYHSGINSPVDLYITGKVISPGYAK